MLGTSIDRGDRGELRIVERLVGAFPRGVYRAVDRTRGTPHLLGVARLDDATADALGAAWPGEGDASALAPLAGAPGHWTVVEPEGAGAPLAHLLGERHTLQTALGLVARLHVLVAAGGDRRPGRFHPALMRVTVAANGLTLTSVSTRCVELMERALGEFSIPLWGPTLFAPECLHGGRVPTAASQVFSSAALLMWLVHGVPPFGTSPLEESRRVAANAPTLRPMLAHLDPAMDDAFALALEPTPAARPPLEAWTQVLAEMAEAHLPDLPRPARPAKFDRKHVLARATDFLAGGADPSRILLDAVIEALQAARHQGPILEAARSDFRDVARAILAGLATPVGAEVTVRFRGRAVQMPGGHAPFPPYALALIWAVATALGEEMVLEALAAFAPPAHDVAHGDDPHWRFLACMQARLRGESWHTAAQALLVNPPPARFPGYASPTPWLAALLAIDPIDPPHGTPPATFALSDKDAIQGALAACLAQHTAYAGDPASDSVDGAAAEVDWFTLALLELAKARGLAIPLEGAALPRWPAVLFVSAAPLDLLAQVPRTATLILDRGISTPTPGGNGVSPSHIEVTGEGHVRAVFGRGRFECGFVAGIGRKRARALFAIADRHRHALSATRWDAAPCAAGIGARDALLGLRFDGETHWWRLPDDAPWVTTLVADLEAAANPPGGI